MPNLDNLLKQVGEMINSGKEGEVRFTSLDMMYAYGQTELQPETARHCNFFKKRWMGTGTYAFNTGYYVLTIIPLEFHKIMDKLLRKIRNTLAIYRRYPDCNEGHVSTTHGKSGRRNRRSRNSAKTRKLQNGKYKNQMVGIQIIRERSKTNRRKNLSHIRPTTPTTLKELRSLMAALNQMNRFILNLPELCAPLRPQQEYRREMGRRTRICISKNNKTETSKVGAVSMAQKAQNIF